MPGKFVDPDVGAAGALTRIALGAALVPLLHTLLPNAGHGAAVASLALVLFMVKAFAAVARRFVPADQALRTQWEWRRNLARYHDSYQWRKLIWYGVGILAMKSATRTHDVWAVDLGTASLVSGAVAEWIWRRKGLSINPPQKQAPAALPHSAAAGGTPANA